MRNPRVLVLDAHQELYLQVRRATSSLRPKPEVDICDHLSQLDQVLSDRGPFALIIAGPSASLDKGLSELRRVRLRNPNTNLVLAFDQWRRDSMRDTVRTGAIDILRLPIEDKALAEAVEQALRNRPDLPEPAPEPVPQTGPEGGGTVIAVVSATGGCGKTFFATNLAYHLQSTSRQRSCLIDLDLQFGELCTALRLRPKYTIADLTSRNGDTDDLGRRFEEHLARHDTGIHVLAAPAEPAEADGVEASDVARVIQAARSRFDHVVVDTPAALSEAVLVALEQADQIFAIATLDLPSVRNLGILLTTLRQLKVDEERIQLVLNKVEPDVGIDVDRVTKYFPKGFSIVIPYGREVNRSLNMGMPTLAYAPRGDVSKVLASGLVRTLVGAEGPASATAASARRLALPGWLRRALA